MIKTHLAEEVCQAIQAPTDGSFRLADYDPAWRGTAEMQSLTDGQLKKQAKAFLKERRAHLQAAQEELYADDRYALLIVFQAMDAAGKDGTIKHVMSGVNPQGCQVFSFKEPSEEDLRHHFMWRYSRALPERGRIGIFNRSYYEEVLVVRVHPELLEHRRLPANVADGDGTFWEARYEDINAFERHLTRNGVVVLKFFLNISKTEQRERFIERLTNPKKLWKFSPSDLEARSHWDDYQAAYQEMIARTSQPWAPWYVIPADNKPVMRALVSHVVTETVAGLDVKAPEVSPERKAELAAALEALRAEEGEGILSASGKS